MSASLLLLLLWSWWRRWWMQYQVQASRCRAASTECVLPVATDTAASAADAFEMSAVQAGADQAAAEPAASVGLVDDKDTGARLNMLLHLPLLLLPRLPLAACCNTVRPRVALAHLLLNCCTVSKGTSAKHRGFSIPLTKS